MTRRIRPAANLRDVCRPLAATAAAALLLAIGACSENRPFERESAAAQAKLAVPSSLTPPISVQDVDGAPAEWKLAERVAEALRSRDIPASAATRSRSAYVLKGELRQGVERKGRSRVEVAWTLYDGSGRKVGDVTQMAAVPGAAFKAPNEGVVEAMADAAAESIAPLVPSSSVELADGAETGERRPNERARADERERVTALGRMPNTTGVSRNLLDPKKREPKTATKVDAKGELSRERTARTAARTENTAPANPGGDKKAVTAVGRYEGTSVLSRNLLRPSGDLSKPLPAPQPPTRQAATEAEESLSVGPMPASDIRKPAPSPPSASAPPTAPAKSLPAASTSRPAQRAEADTAKPDTIAEPERRPKQFAETTEPPTRTTSAGGTQYWIQIGANRDESVSRAEWEKMRAQGGGIFNNAGNRIQRADLGSRGVFYRVQVGPFASAREAGQFCAQLKTRQIDCFLAPPETARGGDTARATPAARPAAKPADPKPKAAAAAPPAAAPAPAPPKAIATPAAPPPAKAEPAEKPKNTASTKKPDAPAAPPAAKPDTKPPTNNASAEKPDAPISTAPGLPGVLD